MRLAAGRMNPYRSVLDRGKARTIAKLDLPPVLNCVSFEPTN
jgi:hypothetical protein